MSQTYPFLLMPLPYEYTALEPYIDAETMQLHHNRHLRTYVDHLNAVLATAPTYQSWTLEQLIQHACLLPPSIRCTCNAGGVFNHEFFFAGMSHEAHAPTGRLAEEIAKTYGSYPAFFERFKAAALDLCGSGYVWLVADSCGNLRIMTTKNQDTPLNCTLLICIDIWEHAYYLQHFNLRADYVDAWFRTADFGVASQRYDDTISC